MSTTPRAAVAEPRTEKGISLARGPALILGTILLAAGLYLIYKQHTFLKIASFPNGTAKVDGKVLFGLFGANGWTGMLTAIAGGLLLFGAAQHLLAKTMSLIVGVALAAAAIIGVTSSGNVLGLAAANGLTELAWGIAAAILLFNTLIPRRRRVVEPVAGTREREYRRGRGGTLAAGAAAGAVAEHEHDKHRERREAARAADDRAAGEPRATGRGGEAAAAGAGAGAGAAAAGERGTDTPGTRRDAGEPATTRQELGEEPATTRQDAGEQPATARQEPATARNEPVDPAQANREDVGSGAGSGQPAQPDTAGQTGKGDGESGGGGLLSRLRPGSGN